MKKSFYLIVFTTVIFLFTNSCGSPPVPAPEATVASFPADTGEALRQKYEAARPPEPEQSEPEEPEPEEDTEQKDALAEERAHARLRHAYAEILSDAYYGHVLPDGSPLETSQAGGQDSGQFSIMDLNGDGEEELVLYCDTGSAHGAVTYVWNYNMDTAELAEYFGGFSPVTFYNNGLAAEDDAYNILNLNFSPYILYQYDQGSNSFVQMYEVTSWNKEDYPTDYMSGNDFPDGSDTDGDGIVYMATDLRNGEFSVMDNYDFEVWRQGIFGAAAPLELSWENLTREVIMAYVRPHLEFIRNDIREAFSDTDLALIYMEGGVDAVQLYLEENGGVSFDVRDEVFYVGTWNGQEALIIDYEDATLFTYLEPMDGVTVLGLTPGMNFEEAVSVLESLGFAPEEGDGLHYVTGLGAGNYGISFEVENDIVASMRFQMENRYAG